MTEQTQKLSKAFTEAVNGLEDLQPIQGYMKVFLALSSFIPVSILALQAESSFAFVILAVISAIIYGYVLIPTHDAIHNTLTGNRFVDETYSRLVAAPIFWMHATYAEMHKLHHKMNGIESADPERKNPTKNQIHHANPILRLYFRHRFLFDVFLFAGIGMIIFNLMGGLRFGKKSKKIRRAIWEDLLTISLWHISIILVLGPYELIGKYYVLFFFWERITGGILHFRAHVEHDSTQTTKHNQLERQMIACRNIQTTEWVSRYYNRLNYHSAHHVFPKIPFYNLKTAHQNLKKVCSLYNVQVHEVQSYLGAAKYILNNKSYYEPDDKGRIETLKWL